MNNKFLISISMLIVFLGVIQPIFAESPMHQTGIAVYANPDQDFDEGTIGHPEEEMYFNRQNINLTVYLVDTNRNAFVGTGYKLLGWRWLNLKVYSINGEQIYSDTKLTEWSGGPVCTELNLSPGDYVLEVNYDGNKRDHLSPCRKIVRLHINKN